MTVDRYRALRVGTGVVVAVAVIGGGGFLLGRTAFVAAPATATTAAKKPLYWYDPMVPTQKFDKPGRSPFMAMDLVPKYADDAPAVGPPVVTMDPRAAQNLGVRVVTVAAGAIDNALGVTGTIEFNQRDIATVQARAGGFIVRTHGLAPGDVVRAGAPIADVLVPEWGGAQAEFLAVKRLGDAALTNAARQRLRLLGMTDGAIAAVERSGKSAGVATVTSPIAGVIQSLDARAGVTLAAGQTLAQVSGLRTVWLNVAVPEIRAADIRVGQAATATLTGFPGERFTGRVLAVLPATQADSRTLTARIELDNRRGLLRPGMFAAVNLGAPQRPALLVPSEAVIRTGTRNLVMLAEPNGRYRPAVVNIGRDSGGQTEILAGLAAGEKIVASGQFLLDSEASLTGIAARPVDGAAR